MDIKAKQFGDFQELLAQAKKRHPPSELRRVEQAFAVAAGIAPPPPRDPLQSETFVFSGIPSQAWYDPRDFEQVDILLSHLDVVRDELRTMEERRGNFRAHSQGSAPHSGAWNVSFIKGLAAIDDKDRYVWPQTSKMVESLPRIAQLAMVSALEPGCHIKPHCGPWNVNLTIHLPLVLPVGDCQIRVGSESRPWKEGECLVFDDSFEHEAWNRGDRTRVVLLIDIWHPALTAVEMEVLQSISDLMVAHANATGSYTGMMPQAAVA